MICPSMWINAGSRKASVFPVPVCNKQMYNRNKLVYIAYHVWFMLVMLLVNTHNGKWFNKTNNS